MNFGYDGKSHHASRINLRRQILIQKQKDRKGSLSPTARQGQAAAPFAPRK